MARYVASPGPRKGDALNGLPYYKAYPRDFIEGTVGMPFEVKCAYRVIIDLLYLQNGRLPDDARYISGVLGCSIRKWKSLRDAMIQAGKLRVDGDALTNERADFELEISSKFQDKQRENAARPRKNNDLRQPKASHTDTDTEYTVTNVTGADAPQDVPLREQIFTRGLRFLTSRGSKEQSARSLIGRWLRDFGDAAVFEAFVAADKDRPADPSSWITARLNRTKGTGNAKQADRLASILAGASPVDSGQGGYTSQPLLARR